MKFFKSIAFIVFLTLLTVRVFAQGNFEKQGTQAWMNGDFKTAVMHLEKVESKNPRNINVLKMLGYSYFQCGDFEKAVDTYGKLLNLKNNDYSGYYYRGKAQLNIANNPKQVNNLDRDRLYSAAIDDFTKAMEVSGEEDVQILQNRGIAFKDYGIFKSYKIKKKVDKNVCIELFNSSINDFQRILNAQPLRKDIGSLVDYVKAQIASIR